MNHDVYPDYRSIVAGEYAWWVVSAMYVWEILEHFLVLMRVHILKEMAINEKIV